MQLALSLTSAPHVSNETTPLFSLGVQAYNNSSVSTHVDAIQGKLLLVHGLVDENVHFRHTARLVRTTVNKYLLCPCTWLILAPLASVDSR
jgi:hypothetical protein